MKIKILFAIVLFVVGTVTAQSVNKDEEAIKVVLKQMADAQTAFDAPALDRIFTADYIEISPAGEFDPRDKVLGFYKPSAKPPLGTPTVALDISDHSIRIYDKFAIVIARLDYVIKNGETILPPRGMRITAVMRKEKGAWKIASTQYTGIRSVQKMISN